MPASVATKKLLSLPEYKAAKRLSVYLSMPFGEISTTAIVHDAFKSGKKVYVPYIYKLDTEITNGRSSVMEMLALYSIDDFESLRLDKWGIPSLGEDTIVTRENIIGGFGIPPALTAPDENDRSGLDLIIMPGLAFDENLRRLGHGMGYYDHFLMKYWGGEEANAGRASQKPYLGKGTQKP